MSFNYYERSPRADLSRFVECSWAFEVSAATSTRVPPDGCVDIVFSPDLGLRVVGAMTTEQIFSVSAGTPVMGVRFRPGMASSILGISVAQLTDTFLDLEDIWPQRGKELKAQLTQVKSPAKQIKMLCNAIQPQTGEVDPVQRAITAISSAHGNINLDYLASEANLSSRQFRRRCYEETGLTPKHLCRILRFRRARQLAQASTRLTWARVAAEAGYFDQAHLIRDFREFTGRTPMSVLSNTEPMMLA